MTPPCQRWRDGSSVFVRGSVIDPRRHDVVWIDEAHAKAFVGAHHYERTYPNAVARYGLLRDDTLAGVAVLSIPAPAVLPAAFPDLQPIEQSLELGRFVLTDEVEANGETWFLARVFALAGGAGLRGVLAHSDPVPRISEGAVIFPGHIGTIYQAANATYAGRTGRRTKHTLPDGTVLNGRALQKIRAGERDRGGAGTVERLIVAGALPPERSGDLRSWLPGALRQAGARTARHAGCHRYLFRLGPPAVRRRVALPPPRPYPKERDVA